MKKIKRFIKSFLEWYYDCDCNIIVVPVAILSILLVVAIMLCIHSYNLALQKGIEDYNNGICRECGELLEYKGSSRSRYYRYDYYICPSGHVVEVFKG